MWWGLDTAAWTALAAWATVATYLALGIFALIQVLQAHRVREEQARPFVVVDLEPGFLVVLTVENLGRTMARNVTIRFDKPLRSTLPEPHDFDGSPTFRGEPIPALPPGKRIRVLFDQAADRLGSDLPRRYAVEVLYRGPFGQKYEPDTYRLDLGVFSGSQLPRKGLPELVSEVEHIRQELARWREGTGGMLVHTVDKRRQNRRELRRLHVRTLRTQGPQRGGSPAVGAGPVAPWGSAR
jgi:hypothetical protein